jgi:hypothetical protein
MSHQQAREKERQIIVSQLHKMPYEAHHMATTELERWTHTREQRKE